MDVYLVRVYPGLRQYASGVNTKRIRRKNQHYYKLQQADKEKHANLDISVART